MRKQNLFELRNVISLALLFFLRMLGLFMILPIFAVEAKQFSGTTPSLIGLALGIYGLSQALLQIPFGLCSDRFGRKPMILLGLAIFILGSVIAASATSINFIIAGRALQGAGAIGSVIMALLADLTPVEHRTKSMAILGISIGFSFACALVIGPLLNNAFGLSGIFWLTAMLGAAGILILYALVPTPPKSIVHSDSETLPQLLHSTLISKELFPLNISIFSLHAILMASFIVIPQALLDSHIASDQQWQLYLAVLFIALLCIGPLIRFSDAPTRIKPIILFAISTLALCLPLFWLSTGSWIGISITLSLFFIAFTFLEATIPSLVSKFATAGSKGTAIGIYSSSQFLGMFAGGAFGGIVYNYFFAQGVFVLCFGLCIIWLSVVLFMPHPPQWASYLVPINHPLKPEQAYQLSREMCAIPGVFDAVILLEEGIAHLKIDSTIVDTVAIEEATERYLNVA